MVESAKQVGHAKGVSLRCPNTSGDVRYSYSQGLGQDLVQDIRWNELSGHGTCHVADEPPGGRRKLGSNRLANMRLAGITGGRLTTGRMGLTECSGPAVGGFWDPWRVVVRWLGVGGRIEHANKCTTVGLEEGTNGSQPREPSSVQREPSSATRAAVRGAPPVER